jgi:hypothetical protein
MNQAEAFYHECAEAYCCARAVAERDGVSIKEVIASDEFGSSLYLFEELLVLHSSIRAIALAGERTGSDTAMATAVNLRNETIDRLAACFNIPREKVLCF